MKPVLSFILFMSFLFINAQDKIEADLLLSYTKIPKVKMLCAPSIKSQSLLFIIDGIPHSDDDVPNLSQIDTSDIKEITVLKDLEKFHIFCGANYDAVILITTKEDDLTQDQEKVYAFKTYEICNNGWALAQDMFNDINAKVPGLTIDNNSIASTPEIRIRGDDNTIVIVDGIRYDTSILNSLNPADIEHIAVSKNVAAATYLINN